MANFMTRYFVKDMTSVILRYSYSMLSFRHSQVLVTIDMILSLGVGMAVIDFFYVISYQFCVSSYTYSCANINIC